MSANVCKIYVSSEAARRRANGYLTCAVGLPFRPGVPTLLWGECPIWRMSIYLHLRGHEPVTMSDSIGVDAMTHEVIPLTASQITAIQDHADEIATYLISSQPMEAR